MHARYSHVSAQEELEWGRTPDGVKENATLSLPKG
jgi:hypothetical protein